jgi:hypothetical protein
VENVGSDDGIEPLMESKDSLSHQGRLALYTAEGLQHSPATEKPSAFVERHVGLLHADALSF